MAHGLNLAKGDIFTENIIRAMLDAYVGNGVISGLAVTEKGAGANMSIDVALGVGRAAETLFTKVSTTNVVVTAADATNPRKDIVVVDSSGTITVVAGTPAAAQLAGETAEDTYAPTAPQIPADKILLAEIWVAAGVTEIYDADIIELGVVVVGTSPLQLGAWGDGSGMALTDDQSAAWYVYGELPSAGSALTGGEVVRGAWERILVNKAQTNNVSIFGSENQLRVKANMAAGVHGGAWIYFEQSGAVTLSGGGINAAAVIAVVGDANLVVDAGVYLVGAVISSVVAGGATMNGEFAAVWTRTPVGYMDWASILRATPSADGDVTMIQLDVTGTPTLIWDESEDGWKWNKPLIFNSHQDADGDTKVQVEESADEDKIRMDVAGVEAFLLEDDGILNLVKQSVGKVYAAGNQNIPNAAWTHILLDSESYDVQNEWDTAIITGTADATEANKLHDADGGFSAADVGKTLWNTTDDTYTTVSGFVDSGELDLTDDIMVNGEGYKLYFSRFTATKAGKYVSFINALWDSPVADQRYYSGIFKNGAHLASIPTHASLASFLTTLAQSMADLAANDYLDFRVYQTSGGVESVWGGEGNAWMSVAKIS